MKQLTIIVVTFNRLDYTRQTITSLMRTVPYARICAWHNGSDKSVLEYLQANLHADNIIQCDENIGWGKAINEGMRHFNVDTEYVLWSNDDCIYSDGWYEKCVALYDKYPKLGLLGVWKHTAHGVQQDLGDLLVKDDMPAVGWLVKSSLYKVFGPVAEHGPCSTKGGNGEDSDYAHRVQLMGYWCGGPRDDVGLHITGY